MKIYTKKVFNKVIGLEFTEIYVADNDELFYWGKSTDPVRIYELMGAAQKWIMEQEGETSKC